MVPNYYNYYYHYYNYYCQVLLSCWHVCRQLQCWELVNLVIIIVTLKVKRYSTSCYSILELQCITCHMRSHMLPATRLTQANTHRLNPSQTGRYPIYLPRRDERWTGHGLPATLQQHTALIRNRHLLKNAATKSTVWQLGLVIT